MRMPTIIANIAPINASYYPIWVDSNILDQYTHWLPRDLEFSRIVVITDHTVRKLYATRFIQSLKKDYANTLVIAIPVGEKSKTGAIKQSIEEKMFRAHCDRNTLILALGGGVVGDIAGFVAATYMRGIPYIQVPTTLLAMVDSSIGGKTGINTSYGKNLIGAFWPPKAIIADITCLRTLLRTQLINGLVEALKIFLTRDSAGFNYLKTHLPMLLDQNQTCLTMLISQAIQLKASIVEQDAKEKNQRQILNFGHTIGHALEKITHYKIEHGYAVALGMLVEGKIAQRLGLFKSDEYLILQETLAQLEITGDVLKKFSLEQLLHATRLDKKKKRSKVHYVLLSRIGAVYTEQDNYAHPVADEVVREAYLEVIKG